MSLKEDSVVLFRHGDGVGPVHLDGQGRLQVREGADADQDFVLGRAQTQNVRPILWVRNVRYVVRTMDRIGFWKDRQGSAIGSK